MIDIREHGGSFGSGKKFNPLNFDVTEDLISINTGITAYNTMKFSVDKINKRVAALTLASPVVLNVYDINLQLIKTLNMSTLLSNSSGINSIILDGDDVYISDSASGSYAIQKITWNITTPVRRWVTNYVYPISQTPMYLSDDRQSIYALDTQLKRINTASGVVEATWTVPNSVKIGAMCELGGKYYAFNEQPNTSNNCLLFISQNRDFTGTLQQVSISNTQYHGVVCARKVDDKIVYLLAQNGPSSVRLMDATGTLLASISSSSAAKTSLASTSRGVVSWYNNNISFFPVGVSTMKNLSFTVSQGSQRDPLWVSEDGTELITALYNGLYKLEKQKFKF